MSTVLWIVFHVLSFHTIVNAIGFAGAGSASSAARSTWHPDQSFVVQAICNGIHGIAVQ
jgi:hypothetical protein